MLEGDSRLMSLLLSAAVCGILGVVSIEALVSPRRGKKK
jgi:hypothetical protein